MTSRKSAWRNLLNYYINLMKFSIFESFFDASPCNNLVYQSTIVSLFHWRYGMRALIQKLISPGNISPASYSRLEFRQLTFFPDFSNSAFIPEVKVAHFCPPSVIHWNGFRDPANKLPSVRPSVRPSEAFRSVRACSRPRPQERLCRAVDLCGRASELEWKGRNTERELGSAGEVLLVLASGSPGLEGASFWCRKKDKSRQYSMPLRNSPCISPL